ncbi:MAG: hypothetical protein JWM21_3143 [Acidobacteria bacterium]|nr:hypothetical protein [Acidobacteriota bacterium]
MKGPILTWLPVPTEPIAKMIRAKVRRPLVSGRLGRLGLALVLLFAVVTGTLAQRLPFPQPEPDTAARAEAQFAARATAVIETNACGREDDYLRIRGEMQQGNFKSQGEDLSHILVAKMAYIRAHVNAHDRTPCTRQILRVRRDFEEHSRLVQLFGPTACSIETHENLVNHTNPTEAIPVQVRVSLECMSAQVNDAIMAMQKKTQMGTSGLPCITSLKFIVEDNGEWDVNVRELVRILYLNGTGGQRQGGILAPSTIDYMYLHLLAARGKLSDASYPTIFGCDEPAGDELGSPEDTADRHSWFKEMLHDLGDFFEWAVITYLTYGLVPGGGALIAAPFLLTAAGGGGPADIALSHWDVRIPESENHRLMIETSKFLTNADIIARLEAENYDLVGEVRDDQAGVRDWLMQRLQDIARNDFQEYNARPYSRYSLNAILNLHDFAAVHGDKDLALAARIVLDLAEAKFAATSNRGRRIVPFRRLSDDDGDENSYLHESLSGADHELARAMLLSGQTQTLDKNRTIMDGQGKEVLLFPFQVASLTLAEMVNAATSDYRLPPPVLATAVERRQFEQTMKHTGVERVEQSPAFTISAGGVRTEPTGTVLGMGRDKDKGVAMPTVIIPTIAGSYVHDLFRFEGVGVHHERSANTCVAPGFACGLQPKLSTVFDACTKREVTSTETLFFVSSAVCFPELPGPHFYLAGRIVECPVAFCNTQWGLMDIVEATPPPAKGVPPKADNDPAYLLFQSQRRAALRAATLDGGGRGVYTSADGRVIVFSLNGAATVVSIDGKPSPDWITAGGAIDADGAGRATLKGPGTPVVIDFSDRLKPKRTP